MDDDRGATHWIAGGVSISGLSHVKSGLPNQDVVRVERLGGAGLDASSPIVILAVADGHGGKSHFRSGHGARVAVDVACDVLIASLLEPNDAWEHLSEFIYGLPTQLLKGWKTRVEQDLAIRPLDAETISAELGTENEAETRKLLESPLKAYGTTLMVVCVDRDRGWLAMQVGDGDIMLVDAEGQVKAAVGEDSRLLGNETTSLCQLAPRDFRARFGRDTTGFDAIVIGTDGVRNSWADEDRYLRFQAHVAMVAATEPHDEVEAKLVGWATRMAHEGACDDTSLAVVSRMRSVR
jgi:hypothetical protein